MLGALTVDVVSDVVCPWCYIGKRRLEAALARLREAEPDLPVEVRWHPFQLNPDLPREGIDRRAYLEAKFGGPERAQQVYARVTRGRRHGRHSVRVRRDRAPAQYARCASPDRVGAGAARRRSPTRWSKQLFRAYFLDGRFVGDHEELVTRAAAAGYDADDARTFLASDELEDAVADADRRARELGVSGRAVLHLRRQDGGVRRARAGDAARGDRAGARRLIRTRRPTASTGGSPQLMSPTML